MLALRAPVETGKQGLPMMAWKAANNCALHVVDTTMSDVKAWVVDILECVGVGGSLEGREGREGSEGGKGGRYWVRRVKEPKQGRQDHTPTTCTDCPQVTCTRHACKHGCWIHP